MIARLSGRLTFKQPGQLIIDVGGVGYRVFCPLSTFYELPRAGEPVELLIRTQVSSEAIHLYAFKTGREKELFELLLNVSGIGPKLALNILSGIQAPDLVRALAQGDSLRLRAIPGVGKKTAERMVVELKDRAAGLAGPAEGAAGPEEALDRELVDDALSALANLGYNRTQAERAVRAALARFEAAGRAAGLESLLKEALRSLAS